MPRLPSFFVALLCMAAGVAQAVDYRSVEPAAAILYDTPSQKGKKLYLIKALTPVELVVRLEGWSKIRDAEGTLAWIESKYLVEKRTVLVTSTRGEVRQSDHPEAALVLEVDKWGVLDYLDKATTGWVKVRHRDGVTGFIRSQQVWGL